MQLLAETDLQLLTEEEINQVAGGLIHADLDYDPITGKAREQSWFDKSLLLLD